MRIYSEIRSEADVENWLDRYDGFHDRLLKELHLVNRDWVDRDGSMIFGNRIDARLLLQSRLSPRAVELLLIAVLEVRIEPVEGTEISGAAIRSSTEPATGVPRFHGSFDGAHRFECRRLFVRERKHWLDRPCRFGSEIPALDAPTARRLEGDWYQCTACTEAFQVRPTEEYAVCPSCQQVTELELPPR